ncbi:MAG: ZIP family magnesium transporter [Gemmatimonas sp.]|nr:ZIP family magnesium transporter [Gemmatimonas sp.]
MSLPILLTIVAALANVAGAAAVLSRRGWSARSLEFVLAFSAGFLVAVSLGDLVPEAITTGGTSASWIILLGFVLVHLTQHVFVRHFHFGAETHQVEHSVGVSALIGLTLHTFVDGVAIATSFAVTTHLGLLVFAAIVLHKLPEGFAISSLFLAAGGTRRAAMLAAGALGVATVLGGLAPGLSGALATHGLALSAGVTLYVGASNLIPEFQGKRGWHHNAFFFAGCGAYSLLTLLLPH